MLLKIHGMQSIWKKKGGTDETREWQAEYDLSLQLATCKGIKCNTHPLMFCNYKHLWKPWGQAA